MHLPETTRPDPLARLSQFLKDAQDTRSIDQALGDAIDYFIDNASWKPKLLLREPARGAQRFPADASDPVRALTERSVRPNIDSSSTGDSVAGDEAFLNECRRHLNGSICALMTRLVHAFRTPHPGNLVEHEAHKWVNDPSNFVAFRIQPQDQSLVVSVKGKPADFIAATLNIRRGRYSNWSEFKLRHEAQLDDAIRVVLASAAGRYSK